MEPDLEEVDTIRRSLVRQPSGSATGQKGQRLVSDRAKKGWLAHQSIFPPSSSSSSETDESDKQTEEDTEDERMAMMGRSRKAPPKSRTRASGIEDEDEGPDGYILSPSELYQANKQVEREDLEEPLLGPDELDRMRGVKGKVPVRLQVYHGRFGHWEREGLRKYKDSGFLALWLTSILGVLVGLLFVWGSTDVSEILWLTSISSLTPFIAARRSSAKDDALNYPPSPPPPRPPHPFARLTCGFPVPTAEDCSTSATRDGGVDSLLAVRLWMVGDRRKLRLDRTGQGRLWRSLVGDNWFADMRGPPMGLGRVVRPFGMAKAEAPRANRLRRRGESTFDTSSLEHR